ncbi:Methylcrotonoyl-CoA carboxylase subunit alpha, mitochondrial [Zancudomyces culisetae]|uniref:Methylcrotonoyl-CoA carboxylase subunit alpha, mitochondrial n=1 Tax=Zancudomyces culisetae TaxID=1213189 RepID=A0A1R1PLV2_ZANCU|nr:Methylcrotonoyl-CoA carboxylase subunit alpha, mitochondrial [Zancudomyces culisetae]|eukprot:OMH81936.1 Methylcrotonoyl-CoA carboxylase subunit alpha, mitochondrial [Zancudomyces culisetae]
MKTAKKLGVKTVAVYSEADADSLHTELADEAYLIGAAPASESYLNKEKILEVIQKTGAQGVHPGYGFLSENAEFADFLESKGVTFIGPPGNAIRMMGSKSESKIIMENAKVPVVPGYHGKNQDVQFLKSKAGEIGYPVLIKAVKGGGGKGMRVVEKEEDFEMMLESSKREAIKSFGDDKVLVEKYITAPRHVEVQVFADKHGNAVYLFERDCSVQRRHQKILEEAPAPHLSKSVRQMLGEKAVAAAKAVGYVGAGTVEFIVDSKTQEFYFMEMNTRLQVEHPVTEMITGTDLVEWQLEVASGNRLPKLQKDLVANGHAFEARIYAENPENGFLPDVGKLKFLSVPKESEFIRVDTGVRLGDEISVYYDPMIAKLIVHGKDRTSAIRILNQALLNYRIFGLHTNINFLRSVLSSQNFIDGDIETGFITKNHDELFNKDIGSKFEYIAQSALVVLLNKMGKFNSTSVTKIKDANSPWYSQSYFRLGSPESRVNNVMELVLNDTHYNITVGVNESTPTEYFINVQPKDTKDQSGGQAQYTLDLLDVKVLPVKGTQKTQHNRIIGINILTAIAESETKLESDVILDGKHVSIFGKHGQIAMEIVDDTSSFRKDGASSDGSGLIVAPMSSKVVQIHVKPGQKVDVGTPLIVVEAMKMEHVIKSSKKGVVKSVAFSVGELVGQGDKLVDLEADQ